MKKKSKPPTEVTVAPNPGHARALDLPPAASLENVRAQHLRARGDAARTISELEAWRDEIDATIAFLKAQKK